MPVDVAVYQAGAFGQAVQALHVVGVTPFLPGKLAVQFIYAVKQAAKEDGEVRDFVRPFLFTMFFHQAGGGMKVDGKFAAGGQILQVAVADVADGRVVYVQAGHVNQVVAGGQALLRITTQGVYGRDGFYLEASHPFAAARPYAFLLPGFVDGQDEVGQVAETIAKEGEAKGETVAGRQVMAGRDGWDEGVGADDGAGVKVGGEQPAGGTNGGVFGGGVGVLTAVAAGFGAGGAAHDVGQGVAQAVAGFVPFQFDGRGGDAVKAEMGQLEGSHFVTFLG